MSSQQFLNFVHYAIVCFVRFILSTILGKGEKVKPVKNDILKQPATSLATKIRQKKVSEASEFDCHCE